MKTVGQRVQLQFKASGAVAKEKTAYGIQLLDSRTGALIIQDTRENTRGVKISWNLETPLPAGTKIRGVLTVARTGSQLTPNPLSLKKSAKFKVK